MSTEDMKMTMESYNAVSLFHVELAVENVLGSGVNADRVLAACRLEMRKKPSPFWHCASMLHARGFSDIVWGALEIASGR